MRRVASVKDGRTLVLDGGAEVRLAGIEITDELRARDLLRWSVGTSWVMVEEAGDGVLVYRSPDALFVNRELVMRGYARATRPGIEQEKIAATYLGIVDPGPRPSASTSSTRPPRTPQAPKPPKLPKPASRRPRR